MVTKTVSYNNNLANLWVEGYDIVPEFRKTKTVYKVNVPYDVNKVLVGATAEEESATILGTGVTTLSLGENNITVTVISEAGTIKTYTIIITKANSDNTYLKDLIISEGILKPDFRKDITTYIAEVEYEIDNIFIYGYPEEETSVVTGNGKKTLNVGRNEVTIRVTSERGTIKDYNLTIIRKPFVSALLKNLEDKKYKLSPNFLSETKEYSVIVNNETTALDLIIETVDPDATYAVTGNENFQIGMNEVKIVVTSSDGNEIETYTIYVDRKIDSSNYLSYILPSEGTLSPSFERQIMKYEIEVPDTIESINISAEPEDKSAKLEGAGLYSLSKGENIVELKVTSTLGIERIYEIKITRKLNDNANLSKLQVKNGSNLLELTPAFDKDILEYNIDVGVGTSRLQIIAEPESELASLTGRGYVMVEAGENKYNIIVTAEDKSTKTYVVNVNRAKSSNNHLIELIPSVGELVPNFAYEEENYTLTVGTGDSLLSFEYSTEDRYAKVTGTDAEVIPDGTSIRKIVVTAEDGSEREYTVTVIKNRTDDARLKSLSVDGYTLEEEFNEDKFIYTLKVPKEVEKLTASSVNAIPKEEKATVTLDRRFNINKKRR
ncbi:MAG: cadherin-like beta sandwich domain-containing protein [Clostridia bacterium]|jgi:hypothetical protein|nr:cadherin-like beta sandwich domain-containing protein [Clostridia bacterium]